MVDTRQILPKLFNTPTAGTDHGVYPPPSTKLSTQRKEKVSVACRICRARRTKCDGARPQCGACELRHSQCGYITKAGQSHSQARKQKMQELENDRSVMLDILCQLQTASPQAAGELFRQLRSTRSGDIEAMLTCIERGRSYSANQELPYSPGMDIDSAEPSPRKLSSATTFSDYQLTPSSTRSQDLSACLGLCGAHLDHDTSHEDVNAALDIFFTCASGFSCVFDRAKVDKVAENITTATGLTFIEFYNRSGCLETTTELSELAAMLAVGMLHRRVQAPEGTPSSEVAAFYYNIGKHGLDSAIEYNPLRAMRLCALLAFYNLSLRSTVALAYIGLGLSLAQDNDINAATEPPENHHQTVRMLIHLQCWLSASMDFVPDSLVSSLKLIVDKKPNDKTGPTLRALQTQALKIALIKRSLLHGTLAAAAGNAPDEPTVAEYRKKLSTYYQDVPAWMSLGQLNLDAEEAGGCDRDVRSTVLYVHLFYMTTMMSLARRLMVAHMPEDGARGPWHPPRESKQAVEEGFMAAQMTARVLDVMLSESSVMDACWLCIHRFTASTACLMILYTSTQETLAGLDGTTANRALIAKCVRILTCCAQQDEPSRLLLARLSGFAATLQRAHERRVRAVRRQRSSVPLADVLFTVYRGETELHGAARELLGLLRRGLGAPREEEEEREEMSSSVFACGVEGC